jgi:serine/threonine protein phosphatase PrpC
MSEGTHVPLTTQATLPAVDIAARSDPGRDPSKQVNEDAYGHRETAFGVLAVVCDGMGGHAGGAEASAAALATIFECFEKAPPTTPPRDVLRDAIRLANVRVRSVVVSDPAGGRPGSTVVAVLVHAGGTEVAHVGDSRAFHVQQGRIAQVTRDHSMVQEMVQAKILTPDQAAVHPDANKITRALGIDDDVEVEVRMQPIAHVAGDALVLCSDGLSDLVEAAEILQIVSSDPPIQAVGKLVDLANARGGYDNITVVIVRPRVSAAAAIHGAVAPTRVSTTVTVRPPGAPTLEILPAVPSPPGAGEAPTREAANAPKLGPKSPLVIAAAVTVVVVLAAVMIRLATRSTSSPEVPDAAPPVVRLGHAPSASVDLVPADLPPPAAVDAAGVTPLEPVPSAAVRHSRSKPTK